MNILYILSDNNLYGGTPKKTLDLVKRSKNNSLIYFYDNRSKFLNKSFIDASAKIYDIYTNRNIIKQIKFIIQIIDSNKVDIIQTQFSRGEVLGFFAKLFRPKVKLIFTFVGTLKIGIFKSLILRFSYSEVDAVVYVSKFVKKFKVNQFPSLQKRKNYIIYNGTNERLDDGSKVPILKSNAILTVAGLIENKNIQILIQALSILIFEHSNDNINLYIAGDGPFKKELEKIVNEKKIGNYVHFLGYQSNIGNLLKHCDIFVHPCNTEGFGIAVAEAMMAEKPIIVSNAGALPELIEHNKSGLIVNPHDAEEWANAIQKLLNNQTLSKKLAMDAKIKAEKLFSIEKFVQNYQNLYEELLEV